MKNFTIFETTIIGFFIGVIVSTYLVFLTSMGGFIGEVLNWVSLKPLLEYLNISDKGNLIYPFIFFVLVYSLYGLMVGIFTRESKKKAILISIVVLILIGFSAYEQSTGVVAKVNDVDNYYPQVASVVKAIKKEPQQYFGNEVLGDLNADGKDDVAFVISRNDKDRGSLYYLTTAIVVEEGHKGTNLIFLGEKMDPQRIYIDNGVIGFEYIDSSNIDNLGKDKKTNSTSNATSTLRTILAEVKEGNLIVIDTNEKGE